MKKCCTCKRELEDTSFHKRSSTKDGLDYTCKECRKIINKASHSKRKESKPDEVKLKAYENVKKWRKENPEKVKEAAKRQRLRRMAKMQEGVECENN